MMEKKKKNRILFTLNFVVFVLPILIWQGVILYHHILLKQQCDLVFSCGLPEQTAKIKETCYIHTVGNDVIDGYMGIILIKSNLTEDELQRFYSKNMQDRIKTRPMQCSIKEVTDDFDLLFYKTEDMGGISKDYPNTSEYHSYFTVFVDIGVKNPDIETKGVSIHAPD